MNGSLQFAVRWGRFAGESCAFMNVIPSKRTSSAARCSDAIRRTAAAASGSWSRHVRRVTANWPPFFSERGIVSLFRCRGRRASFVRSVVRLTLSVVGTPTPRILWCLTGNFIKNDVSVSRAIYIVSHSFYRSFLFLLLSLLPLLLQ